MIKDEALKLALEALEKSIAITMANIDLRNKAITVIKQALAAPVPLDAGEISRLWKRHTNPDGQHHNPYDDDGLGFAKAVLAAAPDLQAELDATNRQVEILCDALAKSRREVAALKAVQEPIGYLFQHEETGLTTVVDVQQVEWGFEKNNPRHQKIGPVYTTPPAAQRQWVGLNEDQRQQVRNICDSDIPAHVFHAIEAKLKEKNT